MDYSTLAIAFTLGLFSSVHCLGMCGGIAGALGLSLPGEVRGRRGVLVGYATAYTVGRIGSYGIAGALSGAFGAGVFAAVSPEYGNLVLRLMAATVIVGAGLYVAGWFPSFASLEAVGVPLWRRLEPVGRSLLPVRSPETAVLYGLVWGWLPCGLVYSTLLWAATSGSALSGFLILVMFGLGTVPVMMSTTVFSRWFAGLLRGAYVRQAIGFAIIATGLLSLAYAGGAQGSCATCGVS
jgi:sulfite exporter TauE/SafE